jgi:DNA-binding response OmpR family regulator
VIIALPQTGNGLTTKSGPLRVIQPKLPAIPAGTLDARKNTTPAEAGAIHKFRKDSMTAEPSSAATLRATERATRAHPHATGRRPRILVVDDDASTRQLNCLLLSRIGYDVDAAEDGEQAWEAMLSTGYDLVITDHNMPLLTGLELVARARAAGMILPAIVDSACSDLGEASDYPHLDLEAVLHKSFDVHELLVAVKRVLPLPPEGDEGTIRTVPEASNVIPMPRPCGTPNHAPMSQPWRGHECMHEPTTAPIDQTETRPAPKRVLIADDDALVRGSLAAVLECEGFVVEEAENGAQAVAAALRRRPDLVLLDLNMPTMDGWLAFSKLDRARPLVPVIIITARPHQYPEAIRLGVDAFMEKPLDIGVLVRAVKRFVDDDEHRHVRSVTRHNFITQLLESDKPS